jgi:undecaprenyl-diphosphatase
LFTNKKNDIIHNILCPEEIMELFREILIAIIYGLTDYLPVSSSGHAWLLAAVFGMDADYTAFLLCMLRISAMFALIAVMFKDIVKLVIGAYQVIIDMLSNVVIFFRRRFLKDNDGYYVLDSNPYKKLVLMVITSSLATLFVSFFIKSVADNCCGMPMVIGICMIISSIVLFMAERLDGSVRTLKNMSMFDAFVIGIAQGIAIMPGISRVAFIFAVATALGFNRNFSLKYSFYLALLAYIGSAITGMWDISGLAVPLSSIGNVLVAMVLVFICSAVVLKFMLLFIKKGSLVIFAVYGGVLGIFVTLLDIII